METNKEFTKGMSVKLPSEKAPAFIKFKLSFKVAEFSQWLSEHENNNGYCDVDVLESKDGTKYYGQLNEYKPAGKLEEVEETRAEDLEF